MAVAARRKTGEADLFAALRDGSARLLLLYGQEASLAEEIATRLGATLGADAERVDIDSGKLRDDAGLLSGEANMPSLFGTARWIRLRFARDEGLEAVEALLAAAHAGAPVIATAGNLTAASKLRKLAEGHPLARALPCYAPRPSEAADFVIAAARAEGVMLERRLAQRIADNAACDRALSRGEVVKLALYLDAAPDRPRTATPADVEAMAAETAEEDVGALVTHLMAGDARKLAEALVEARGMAVNEVRIVKAVQRRAVTLAGLAARRLAGEDPDSLVKGVFWMEREAVKRELVRWNPQRLRNLVSALLDLEQAVMDAGRDTGGTILAQRLIGIARATGPG